MTARLRILLTNDDGAATPASGNSPFIYSFALALRTHLNADVRVVVPASQQSWKGKAYNIADKINGQYFYPLVGEGEDGTKGEKRDLPRKPEEREEGEMEWVLLDGTPSTCANIGLHNLFAPDSFDLVISGPNFGRNTSTAFALSSGTVGAALSASLSGLKTIAVSYGLMAGYKNPTPPEFVDAANVATCKIIEKLYAQGWKEGAEKVDVYTVNVPLSREILSSPTAQFTTMHRTGYGSLFKPLEGDNVVSIGSGEPEPPVDEAGPAAVPEPTGEDDEQPAKRHKTEQQGVVVRDEHHGKGLKFSFQPDLQALVNPDPKSLPAGTDVHALHQGLISIVPIRAAFAEVAPPTGIAANEKGVWKL